MLAPANEDCDDPGIFLGPITVTSPASDSNADSSIIVSYVEVPESAEEQIEIGSSYIFDLYQSGNTLTMRNDHFESSGLWPTGGLDLTRRSSDFDINGIYDGNDTSITYIQNEFYMRLGGFSDEVQSEDDYSGASAGVVEDTSTAGRYTVIPVVDSDGGGDDDDSGAGPSFSVDFSRSGGQLVADVSVSQFDLIFTDRPTDALNGVWYGRDPENGAESIQSTEFFNGIFFAYRFQCNDGIESSSTNLTLAAYIGRYEILPNDQIRLLYSHVINSESGDDDNDVSGYEVVFDSVLTSDQLSLTGRFCVGCDPFTITLNQADRAALWLRSPLARTLATPTHQTSTRFLIALMPLQPAASLLAATPSRAPRPTASQACPRPQLVSPPPSWHWEHRRLPLCSCSWHQLTASARAFHTHIHTHTHTHTFCALLLPITAPLLFLFTGIHSYCCCYARCSLPIKPTIKKQ